MKASWGDVLLLYSLGPDRHVSTSFFEVVSAIHTFLFLTQMDEAEFTNNFS